MNKKIILGFLFFTLLIVMVPLVQSILFANQSTGKITIDEKIDAPYLKHSEKDLILVFFGYVGCVNICTPILHQLDEFYDSKSFEPYKHSVELTFVNLMPELDADQPKQFAKSFNPHFNGVYLSQKELMNIDRELGVFFSKSMSDPTEIDHSDNLYLVKRQKDGTLILKYIYSMHPLKKEMLIHDISELEKEKE